jgi:hypothetical protein
MAPFIRHLVSIGTLLPLFRCLVRAEPIPLPFPVAIALPEALPAPTPVAAPEPVPEALPDAEADPDAQTYYNYSPFSGAIYIVGADGAGFSQASPAICPNQAPQGCGNINIYNWYDAVSLLRSGKVLSLEETEFIQMAGAVPRVIPAPGSPTASSAAALRAPPAAAPSTPRKSKLLPSHNMSSRQQQHM